MLRRLAVLLLGAAAAGAAAKGPCDLYARHGTPCIAAHSTTRALYGSYAGALYCVQRGSDGATTDIGVVKPGGYADAAAQERFCPPTEQCSILRIFDQSPQGNHIEAGFHRSTPPAGEVRPWKEALGAVNATKRRLTASGHPVYAAVFEGQMGYRNDSTSGVATGDEPESIYMVVAGGHFNDQ